MYKIISIIEWVGIAVCSATIGILVCVGIKYGWDFGLDDALSVSVVFAMMMMCVVIDMVFIINEIHHYKWWRTLSNVEKAFYKASLD